MASEFLKQKAQINPLGIGLGLRREMAEETFAHSSEIDWVEIAPENYMDTGGEARQRLEETLERYPLISHGLNLSIGSTDELNFDYLRCLKKLLDEMKSPWWSDHLCFTSVENLYIQDLLPLPFSKEAVKHIVERIKRVQDFMQRPFLLENISFYMYMPGNEMPETEFIREIVEKADCGLLLDVNNVIVNSINHKFDPYEFVKELPLEHVLQIHVAGHKKIGDYIIDTHGAAVIDPVFELLDFVLQKTDVRGIMLERDQNFPDFAEILQELKRLREIAAKNKQFQSPGKVEMRGLQRTNLRGKEPSALTA
ncbi:MAG: DUF692 domain-containing protein [Candidatus Obscuribacterales bacterium]|nr:DUF692 domain-containing protein [Candidatus Obscuribacterales bacterium]